MHSGFALQSCVQGQHEQGPPSQNKTRKCQCNQLGLYFVSWTTKIHSELLLW